MTNSEQRPPEDRWPQGVVERRVREVIEEADRLLQGVQSHHRARIYEATVVHALSEGKEPRVAVIEHAIDAAATAASEVAHRWRGAEGDYPGHAADEVGVAAIEAGRKAAGMEPAP